MLSWDHKAWPLGWSLSLMPWHWLLDLAWLPCCAHLPLAAGTRCGHTETRMGLLKGLGVFNIERGNEGASQQRSSNSWSIDLPTPVPQDKDPESQIRWQENVSWEGKFEPITRRKSAVVRTGQQWTNCSWKQRTLFHSGNFKKAWSGIDTRDFCTCMFYWRFLLQALGFCDSKSPCFPLLLRSFFRLKTAAWVSIPIFPRELSASVHTAALLTISLI